MILWRLVQRTKITFLQKQSIWIKQTYFQDLSTQFWTSCHFNQDYLRSKTSILKNFFWRKSWSFKDQQHVCIFNGMSSTQVKGQIKGLKICNYVLLVEMLCNKYDMQPVKTGMINNREPQYPRRQEPKPGGLLKTRAGMGLPCPHTREVGRSNISLQPGP